jgi:glyoxylase-like metal-dependent hydrolase (beta-lactamase superfamily II)
MPVSVEPYQIDSLFETGQPLRLAGLEISIAHVPGHATDGVIFHLPAYGIVFSGDTLFAASIGRTDLPGGSTRQLLDGIARHLLILPPETRVLSGHGPATTIGGEMAGNPFLE